MSDEEVSDEKFSCELLRKYLEAQGSSGFDVRLHPNDPPDIVVEMKNGDRWGVEVTRVYLQVSGYNEDKDCSSEDLIAPLRRYGEEIGRMTRNQRTRNYILFLGFHGPAPADSLNQNVVFFNRKWKAKTKKLIRQHIEKNGDKTLKRPGIELKPGGPGCSWKVYTSPGVSEIPSATSSMLERALETKCKKFPWEDGNFVERWLLLLNRYPFAECSEVREMLCQIVRSQPSLCGFDGVLWSDYSGRALVKIPFPRD